MCSAWTLLESQRCGSSSLLRSAPCQPFPRLPWLVRSMKVMNADLLFPPDPICPLLSTLWFICSPHAYVYVTGYANIPSIMIIRVNEYSWSCRTTFRMTVGGWDSVSLEERCVATSSQDDSPGDLRFFQLPQGGQYLPHLVNCWYLLKKTGKTFGKNFIWSPEMSFV